MAYPMGSRGLDPRMQRIIEAAGASDDNEHFDAPPFSRPAASMGVPAPPTGSRHFNNGSSLSDMFAYQGARPPQSPMQFQPSQHEYSAEPYAEPRQALQPSYLPRTAPRNSNPSRISMTPRSLHSANNNPSYVGEDQVEQGLSFRPNDFTRASTLANLRTQPQSNRSVEVRMQGQDVQSYTGSNRHGQLHLQTQQPTPPVASNGSLYTPPGQRSSSPNPGLSSPTNRVIANRESRITLPHKAAQGEPQTPTRPSFGADQYYSTMKKAVASTPVGTVALRAPPVTNGIQLISTRDLPDRFRTVFPFPLFNAIQSKVFPAVYGTNDNVVVSAPTGGGKTAILELAIIKLIQTHTTGQFKIVYQAPTKSLCSERARDWAAKFSSMNIETAELTGDTDASELRKVGNATIIVTTPEKWDSITRKWKDHVKLLQLVKLFLIDEVHILKESRGATLEAVVSRMKSIGSQVRFVALSATVPNSHDIALWLGKDHTDAHLPAHRETFGEEFRPVKLQKHVHGFESNGNDYSFDAALTSKLPGLISKHTHKKPMMVFCFTRKSCESTAAMLAEWWAKCKPTERAWPAPTERVPVTKGNATVDLRELVLKGVAYHHAGLDPADRMAIEKGYLKGQISVICCTSTLAVGVNLPCHLVVLKGTVGYQDGQLCEYSDLEVMQMLGRAGRPQFDDTAVAIIMTNKNNVDRYNKMMSGQDVLESTLHLNLIEHLNSEIGLGTVHNLYTAKTWLGGTFLSVRMKKNPKYYTFISAIGSRDADERLELVCERDIKLLQDAKLITSEARFACTKYGEAMSKYMVKFDTMQLLLSIPEHAKISRILDIVSQASEFKDLKLKSGERAQFRELNKSAFIKWPIKQLVNTAAHKTSLIVQVQLGSIDLPDKDFNRRQYLTEQSLVFDRIQRLVLCVVECKAHDRDAIATQNALELSRSISAGYWEYMPTQLRQISNVGAAATRKFVAAGITTIDKLIASDGPTLERIMSRNPPYGHKLLETLKDFPRLTLKAEVIGRIIKAGRSPQAKIRTSLGMLNTKVPRWNRQLIQLTFMAGVSNGNLSHMWRGSIKKLEKGFDFIFLAELLYPSDTVSCFVACDKIVGTVKSVILAHGIPESEFPPPGLVMKKTPKVVQSIEAADDFDYDAGEDWDGLMADVSLGNIEPAVEGPVDTGNADDFVDIDDIVNATPTQAPHKQMAEPVQLPSGKWECKHACRGGKVLKNGVTCKHKCCVEGVEKPSKPAAPKKQKDEGAQYTVKPNKPEPRSSQANPQNDGGPLKFSRPSNEVSGTGEVDVLDLSQVLPPVPYQDIAPREYRKLHALHNQTTTGTSVTTLHNVRPKANYSGGADPFAIYLRNAMPTAKMFPDSEAAPSQQETLPTYGDTPSGWMNLDDGSDEDLPSPSKLKDWDANAPKRPVTTELIGYSEDLYEDEGSYMIYGRDAVAGSYPVSEHQQTEPTPTLGATTDATSGFMNDMVDYDAYSSVDPLSSRAGSTTDTNDSVLCKRRLGLEVSDSFEREEKRARTEGQQQPAHATVPLRGAYEGALQSGGLQPRPGQKPWPKWVHELAKTEPETIAFFDGWVEWESDKE